MTSPDIGTPPTPETDIDPVQLAAAYADVVADFPERANYAPLIQLGWVSRAHDEQGNQAWHGADPTTGTMKRIDSLTGVSPSQFVPQTLMDLYTRPHEAVKDPWNIPHSSENAYISIKQHHSLESQPEVGEAAVIRGCGQTAVFFIGYGGERRNGIQAFFMPGEGWSLAQIVGLAEQTFLDDFADITRGQAIKPFGEIRITPEQVGVPFREGMSMEYQGVGAERTKQPTAKIVSSQGSIPSSGAPRLMPIAGISAPTGDLWYPAPPAPSAERATDQRGISVPGAVGEVAIDVQSYLPKHRR